jgi:hypothetical protein
MGLKRAVSTPLVTTWIFVAVDTAGDQIGLEGIGDRHDRKSFTIEVELQLLEQLQKHPVLHCTDRADRFRPDVTKLEDPRPALDEADHVSGAGGEELRRGANDHVDTSHE